jgi:hypothetical protein
VAKPWHTSLSTPTPSYWLIPDFPADAKFLTAREREFTVHRLLLDEQYDVVGEKFSWTKAWSAFASVKTFLGAFVYMGCDAAVRFRCSLPSTELKAGSFTPSVYSLPASFRAWATAIPTSPTLFRTLPSKSDR